MHTKPKNIFGLIGYPLSHSFSQKYFSEKFEREHIADYRYELFPLTDINELPTLLSMNALLSGLNVTIPYKQTVISLLDEIDEEASAIGAVNVIQISEGRLKGYNSDAYGFEVSLRNFLSVNSVGNLKLSPEFEALVLGTGGASKSVTYVLEKLGISYKVVSRKEKTNQLTYKKLTKEIIESHRLIVNCTPLGTYPDIEGCPDLPYDAVSPYHYFYDLVYNPAETLFLKKGKAQGAHTINGLEMLHLQAERAWEIWNDFKLKN